VVEPLNYLETAPKNQNSIHEGVKNLESEKDYYYYYYSVQDRLSFGLLAKNIKILENCNFARFLWV